MSGRATNAGCAISNFGEVAEQIRAFVTDSVRGARLVSFVGVGKTSLVNEFGLYQGHIQCEAARHGDGRETESLDNRSE